MAIIKAFDINESQLEILAKNLRILLNEHGKTENDVAQALKIPVMTVRRLVSGETADPRISTLKLIAEHFNVSIDSLIVDNDPLPMTAMSKNIPRFVPILDWNTVANIKSLKEIDLKEWKDWYPLTLGNNLSLSNQAFALESRPSMQPRFLIGTLFILDPHELPNDGDLVLIKMKKDGELSLRELIIDSPRWQLQPIIMGSEMLFFDKEKHHILGIVMVTIFQTRKR